MSKKTRQRELERARAKRQAEAYARRQKRVRTVAMALILAMGGGVLVAAALSTSGNDEPLAITDPTTTEPFGVDEDDPVALPSEPPPAPTPQPAIVAPPCESPTEGAPESARLTFDQPPAMSIDTTKSYVATVETTCGTIVLELDATMAPITVNNFVTLAQEGYYDGAPFHRVIDDFMIQGGDPSGTGHGDGGTYPGYTFADELELAEQLVGQFGGYPRGTLAMANSGPDTNGSQFFILQVNTIPAYPLPPQYTAFGRTVDGIDVVDRIVAGPAQGDLAVEPVRIISISISEA